MERRTDGRMDKRTDRHGSKTVLSSIHVVERLLFSMVPLILTFDINPILRSFFGFWGQNGLFFGWR